VDYQRGVKQHLAFGAGRHSCVGAPLARAELAIAIEEWLARVPTFRLDEAQPPSLGRGFVFTVTSLSLRWD
jgi:cytochrome P450